MAFDLRVNDGHNKMGGTHGDVTERKRAEVEHERLFRLETDTIRALKMIKSAGEERIRIAGELTTVFCRGLRPSVSDWVRARRRAASSAEGRGRHASYPYITGWRNRDPAGPKRKAG